MLLATCVASAERLPDSTSPIQQLTGQLSNHDSQYQCGQPFDQFGMMATTPITSPRMNSQNTCVEGRRGAKRAHTYAHAIEITMKNPVLQRSGASDGIWPFSKSPGKIRLRRGSVQSTRTIDSA